jgi:hypothetical protein
LAFRLWCGSNINQVLPSILLFFKAPSDFLRDFPTCFYHFDRGLPLGCFPFSFKFKIFSEIAVCISISNVHGVGSLQSLLPTAGYLLYFREESRLALYS